MRWSGRFLPAASAPTHPSHRPASPSLNHSGATGYRAGLRLHVYLAGLGLRGNAAKDALAHGKVLLDGVPVSDAGREVDPARVRWAPDARRIQVGREPVLLHHDAWFAWVWKPSGFLAVPAPGRHHPSVVRFVERALGVGLPVHRLDEATSGVMIVARDETAQTRMKALFEVHAVERRYIAIVRGSVGAPFTATSLLVRDRGDGLRGSGPGGKPATTHVAPVQGLRAATLIEARLETGRTHQVRIHLSERGHPLLGDPLYGDGRGAPRLALHAATLGFAHPFTGAMITIDTPLADDLEILRRRLS